jgi:cyclic di-GMP phosphodiesterase
MSQTTLKKSVLVVDDESYVTAMLMEMLERQGMLGEACNSGIEALEMLAEKPFDLVISDFDMPGMDGMRLLKEVRLRFPLIAFIMATGSDDVRLGVQAMKEGAKDYILKPFQIDSVVASVHRALEMKRLESELKKHREQLEDMVSCRTKELALALKRVETTYGETLRVLGGALDLRDNETAGHSQRVTAYSLEIANAMGWGSEQLLLIERGAYLHDLGKIGIPDAILRKPGKLNDEERAIMETHVRIGYDLVAAISFLAGPAEIVLTHQESFDGSGYPRRLAGNQIPSGSRIFAVADTLDAMTSDRPYRRALPYLVARDEITRNSGKQFDPEVVRVFLNIPQSTWQNIRTEVTEHRATASERTNLSPET